MSATYAVQKALRLRLASTPGVLELVSAGSILDRNARPAPDPSIIIGEAQATDEGDTFGRERQRVFSTVHVWKRELGLAGVQAIAGAIRAAINPTRLALDGYSCADCMASDMRFLRDPDGETAHAVITIETIVEET